MRKSYVNGLLLSSVLSVLCGEAFADISLSAIGMGHGAPNAAAFAQFQEAVRQYSASGERFRIDTQQTSRCQSGIHGENVEHLSPRAEALSRQQSHHGDARLHDRLRTGDDQPFRLSGVPMMAGFIISAAPYYCR